MKFLLCFFTLFFCYTHNVLSAEFQKQTTCQKALELSDEQIFVSIHSLATTPKHSFRDILPLLLQIKSPLNLRQSLLYLQEQRVVMVFTSIRDLEAIFKTLRNGKLTSKGLNDFHLDLQDSVEHVELLRILQENPEWLRVISHLHLASNNPFYDDPSNEESASATATDILPQSLPDSSLVIVALAQSAAHVTQLTDLHLNGALSGGDQDIHVIATSTTLSHVKKLDLSDNNLGPASAEALSNSAHLTHLQELNLAHNGLQDFGVFTLVSSANVQHIEKLNLYNNSLTQIGGVGLFSTANLQQLKELDVGFNLIGDAGLLALALNPHFQSLTTLYIGHNNITDAGIRAIIKSPYLQNLTFIDLEGNDISPEVQQQLRDLGITVHHTFHF